MQKRDQHLRSILPEPQKNSTFTHFCIAAESWRLTVLVWIFRRPMYASTWKVISAAIHPNGKKFKKRKEKLETHEHDRNIATAIWIPKNDFRSKLWKSLKQKRSSKWCNNIQQCEKGPKKQGKDVAQLAKQKNYIPACAFATGAVQPARELLS